MKKLIRIFFAAVTVGVTAGAALADSSSTSNTTPPPPVSADGARAYWAG